MKTTITFCLKFFTFGLLLFVGNACSDGDTLSRESQIEKYYRENLHTNKEFLNFVGAVDKMVLYVEKVQAEKKLKGETFRIADGDIFDNFDEGQLNELSAGLQAAVYDFNVNNPNFGLLSPEIKTMLMNNAITQMTSISGLQYATLGTCEAQRESTRQTCWENSVLQAAFCGMLSETVVPALLCAVGVIINLGICYDDADRTYEICKGN